MLSKLVLEGTILRKRSPGSVGLSYLNSDSNNVFRIYTSHFSHHTRKCLLNYFMKFSDFSIFSEIGLMDIFLF